MSSRATKKRVWKLTNMSNGDWLNMIRKMDYLEELKFSKWCYSHGLINKYKSYIMTGTRSDY